MGSSKFLIAAVGVGLISGCGPGYGSLGSQRIGDANMKVRVVPTKTVEVSTAPSGYIIRGHGIRGAAMVQVHDEPFACGAGICTRSKIVTASKLANLSGIVEVSYSPQPKLCGSNGGRRVTFTVTELSTGEWGRYAAPAYGYFTEQRCP